MTPPPLTGPQRRVRSNYGRQGEGRENRLDRPPEYPKIAPKFPPVPSGIAQNLPKFQKIHRIYPKSPGNPHAPPLKIPKIFPKFDPKILSWTLQCPPKFPKISKFFTKFPQIPSNHSLDPPNHPGTPKFPPKSPSNSSKFQKNSQKFSQISTRTTQVPKNLKIPQKFPQNCQKSPLGPPNS